MASVSTDEFVLNPPSLSIMASSEQPWTCNEPSGVSRKNVEEYRVLLSDNTLHALYLPVKSTGKDCLDQICGILGIVEKDYFGLQYRDAKSGYRLWINGRIQVRTQIKSKPPYFLTFRVKYYTQPNYLLQTSTIDTFFMDLKSQIKRGDIHVPNAKKALIGARIAQAEIGDIIDRSGMVYPPYFTRWNSGIAHIIAKEHQKLKGVSKKDAQLLFIQAVYEVDNYGMIYARAIINGELVIVGIGAKCLRIFTREWRCKTRISCGQLSQVAFGNKFFSFTYNYRDEERNYVEKKTTAFVYSHTLAKSLFRAVTEEQVFHYQPVVTPLVLNHADTRETIWKSFCRKVFKKKYEKMYYYDIQRTKKESYSHHWQILNQVALNEMVTEPPEEPPETYVNLANNHEDDLDEEHVLEKQKLKAEVYWGLSESSTNLAKELLPSEYITLSPSKEQSLFTADDSAHCTTSLSKSIIDSNGTDATDTDELLKTAESSNKTSQPLTKEQGRKMFNFLIKIQDEKVCNVCMDELISSVFCPCGHYVACERCAKKLDKCPVCRHPIGYVQFVYTK